MTVRLLMHERILEISQRLFVNCSAKNACFVCILVMVADIDECGLSDNVCGNGSCENTPGRFICHCLQGFESTMMMQVCSGRYYTHTLAQLTTRSAKKLL